ncbi:MAG: hypothetical protein QW641_01235 [Candidatus Aenigmatarchaeota archaeon]
MDFEAVVKNRHSIRAFLQKEIEEEKLKNIRVNEFSTFSWKFASI